MDQREILDFVWFVICKSKLPMDPLCPTTNMFYHGSLLVKIADDEHHVKKCYILKKIAFPAFLLLCNFWVNKNHVTIGDQHQLTNICIATRGGRGQTTIHAGTRRL
jgi:hypothetical protein